MEGGTAKRAAIYVRVSIDRQSVENQIRELGKIAERRGWQIVAEYRDAGISGAKGRDGRPGLDQMLKDACQRKFDVVMAWGIDRLGRSLIDLLGSIQTLESCGDDLYLDQQVIDTTTPAGKLIFQVRGAFAEFERSMNPAARQRRAKTGRRAGQDAGSAAYTDGSTENAIRKHLQAGTGIRKTAQLVSSAPCSA